MTGVFISIEGVDGGGKTTMIPILVDHLRRRGYTVTVTREPGGTVLGEMLRGLLLGTKMTPMAELLLFAAMRAEHIEKTIKPAIARGEVVISDRFADSTYAYQGLGRGYVDQVLLLENLVHCGFEPDHTLFFNASLETGMKRIAKRMAGAENNDRFEIEQLEFKQRVHKGYQQRYMANKKRMQYIDAEQSQDRVTSDVISWVDTIFVPSHPITAAPVELA